MSPVVTWTLVAVSAVAILLWLFRKSLKSAYRRAAAPLEPLPEESRTWIEENLQRLADRYGTEYLSTKRTVLPKGPFDPKRFRGSEDDARELFDKVCAVYGLDPEYIRFEIRPTAEAAGLYQDSYTQTVILSDDALSDFWTTVAVLAHELAHTRLYRDSVYRPKEFYKEEFTDLTAILFGFGIFITVAYPQRIKYYGSHGHAVISGLGYLKYADITYVLGLLQWLGKEEEPAWAMVFDKSVRGRLQHVVKYLEHEGSIHFGIPLQDLMAQPVTGDERQKLRRLLEDAVRREDFEYAAMVKKTLDQTEADQMADQRAKR